MRRPHSVATGAKPPIPPRNLRNRRVGHQLIPSAPGKGPFGRLLQWVAGFVFLFLFLATLNLFYVRWFDPSLTTVQMQRQVEAWIAGDKEYRLRQQFVPLTQIPQHVQHAVIAAEDGRFYEHFGFDWQEVEKVIEQAKETKEVPRGASTITQQLVKNLFLTTHRSPIRKIFEYPMVPLAELTLPKQRILELYLNVVEWGPSGVFGIEAAARHHYGISARQLSREQAARLAAILPSPRRRAPQRMNQYASIILNRMQSRGW